MESMAIDLKNYTRRSLSLDHVEQLRARGEEIRHDVGDLLTILGEPQTHFHYIVAGRAEAVDPIDGSRYSTSDLGPEQFVGEIGFLSDTPAMLGTRVTEPCTTIAVPRDAMLDLMSKVPEMGDLIVTVFAARRRQLIESSQTPLLLIGAQEDTDVRCIEAFASRNRIPFTSLALGSDAARAAASSCDLPADTPGVVFGGREVISPITPRAVAKRLNLDLSPDTEASFDVLIIGGGPAGVAAAVYAGAEGLCAIVVESIAIGGQAGTSSRIENYMGFPTGISGADLCWRGEIQAITFGARFAVPRRVEHIERREGGGFCVRLNCGGELCARAVIIATGVQYRRLPLERLEAFEGRGVYYAATETEARYCREQEVVVIGGGNSAGQAAMFLSRTARHVHVLIRGDSLASSMSEYLSSRLIADASITLHYHTEMTDLHGESSLEGIKTRHRRDNTTSRLDVGAVFIMIGAAPNTEWLGDLVQLDEKGFVKTGAEVGADSGFGTSSPGVFAVGDVRSGSVKRVASAVGEGSVVISRVWQFVHDAS